MKSAPVTNPHGMLLMENLSGVVDGDLMVTTIIPHLDEHIRNRKSLVIMDSARAHLTKKVVELIRTSGHVPWLSLRG